MKAHHAMAYQQKMMASDFGKLQKTDPEFVERFSAFAFEEVPLQDDLGDHTRGLAILAILLGCQGREAFHDFLPVFLKSGVTAIEVKEVVYQAVAYLGMGRVLPFLKIVNTVFADLDIDLPLPGQAKTTLDTRLMQGVQAQVAIFGEGMKEFYQSGPEESRHINRWLADNCFGDYYTRGGLDLAQREMITFCFLFAQGGCEPQLLAHTKANLQMGNDKKFLLKILSQGVPFIGYPRTLNALRCLNEAAKE